MNKYEERITFVQLAHMIDFFLFENISRYEEKY
jgi:hypothetical protein